MVRTRVKLAFAGAGVIIATSLAACGSDDGATGAGSAQGSNKDPIVVGQIVDLSGALQDFNRAANPGYEYGWDDINKNGGINGAQIKIVQLDTGSKTPEAPLLVRKVAQQKAVAIVGPYSSNMAVAAAPVAAQLRIPMLLPTSIADWHGEFNDFTFRITPSLDVVIPKYLPQVLDKIQAKRIGIVYDKANEASVTAYKEVKEALPQTGATLAGEEAFQTGDVDFTAQISNLLNGKPDAIWISSLSTEAALVIRQIRQRGFKGRFISESTLNNPELLEQSGGAAKGLITYQVFNPEGTDPQSQSIRDRFGKNVPGTIGQAYAATQVLAAALKAAEDPHDPQSVRDALGATKDVTTVIGPVTWANKGNNSSASFTTLELTDEGFVPFTG